MTRREYQLRGIDARSRKTYLWEDEWGDWNRRGFKTKAKAAQVLNIWASRRWKVKPARVHYLEGNKMSYTQHSQNKEGEQFFDIYLVDKHNNVAITLHETAHAIDDQLPNPVKEHHGKRWLAIYLDLLGASGFYPKAAVEASAKASGLSWDTKIKPPKKKARR